MTGIPEFLTPYVYYITGWSIVNPAMATMMASAVVMIFVGLFNMTWFLYLKRKIENIYRAMFGLGKQLGLEDVDMFSKSVQALKGK